MTNRIAAGAIGFGLVALAVIVSGVIGDSAVAVVLAIGGVALILFAVFQERLKSVGPKGVELFEDARERTAKVFETRAAAGASAMSASAGVATGVGEAHSAEVRTASFQAAAEIRAAETPEQFAGVVGRLLDRVEQLERPESSGEAYQRVDRDDQIRETRARYGPSRHIK